MKVAVCIDKDNGMMLFGRRLSMDRVQREKLLSLTDGKIFVNEFTADQFETSDRLHISENFLDEAGENDICFVENVKFDINKVSELYIFNWNRRYPSDVIFDYDISSFKRIKTEKFEGYSHPKITLETYIRKV